MKAPFLLCVLLAGASSAAESRIDESKHNFFGPGNR